ncbi:MAG: NAD(P)H-binding protein [Woeseiaceae bacterium]|nr:NAD(P)H-binding protein [Woeseiaceae bacterium]
MRVAIFGATGFVGNYLVRALLDKGDELSVLVRPGSEPKLAQADRCRVTQGDIGSTAAIRSVLDGCDAVIYNIGLLKEFPRRGITFDEAHFTGVKRVIEAAQSIGVKRFVLMSANGVKQPGTPYQETKFRAEQMLRGTDLDWTIFQPSVIFGDSGGTQEFSHQLYSELVKPPVPAVAFPGVEMSPVFIDDVVDAFVNALTDPAAVGQTYALGGPEILSWKQMVERVATAAGRDKWFVTMPLALMKTGATFFDWLPFFPATRDQLTMLEEGNTADPSVVESLIGRPAAAFDGENLAYLQAPSAS